MEVPEASLYLIGRGGHGNHSSSKNNINSRDYSWSPLSRPGHSRWPSWAQTTLYHQWVHITFEETQSERRNLPQILILQLLNDLARKPKLKPRLMFYLDFSFWNFFSQSLWCYNLEKKKKKKQAGDSSVMKHQPSMPKSQAPKEKEKKIFGAVAAQGGDPSTWEVEA